MEQFNLEKYLANPSRKVVTRDGRNVRIVCTDRNINNFPIVALIQLYNDSDEEVFTYTKDGKRRVDESTRHDLFFATEKHEGWVNLYKDLDEGRTRYMGNIYNSKEGAENSIINNGRYLTTLKIEWEE